MFMHHALLYIIYAHGHCKQQGCLSPAAMNPATAYSSALSDAHDGASLCVSQKSVPTQRDAGISVDANQSHTRSRLRQAALQTWVACGLRAVQPSLHCIVKQRPVLKPDPCLYRRAVVAAEVVQQDPSPALPAPRRTCGRPLCVSNRTLQNPHSDADQIRLTNKLHGSSPWTVLRERRGAQVTVAAVSRLLPATRRRRLLVLDPVTEKRSTGRNAPVQASHP